MTMIGESGPAAATQRRSALLAGLGWALVADLQPGELVERSWAGLRGHIELRADGDRRIARFRWELPEGDGGRLPGATGANRWAAAPAATCVLGQSSTINALGIFVTTVSDAGLVEDRHRVVRSAVWAAAELARSTCTRVDRDVSPATIARVFAELVDVEDLVLTDEEQAFFRGLLSSGDDVAHVLGHRWAGGVAAAC